MEKLEVFGANKLKGQIKISGSKNASLPILAATLLSNKKIVLKNLPKVRDIKTMLALLQSLGSKVKVNNNQTFIEYSPLAFRKLSTISKIIRRQNGGILIIDYGYNKKRMFNTLQSVKNHKKNDFLENIYHSDITHMINFDYYKKKIKKMKLDFIKLTTQKNF